jgi:hypothetical protein
MSDTRSWHIDLDEHCLIMNFILFLTQHVFIDDTNNEISWISHKKIFIIKNVLKTLNKRRLSKKFVLKFVKKMKKQQKKEHD